MKILCTSQIGSSTALGQTMRVVAIAKALQHRGAQVKFLAGDKLIPVVQNFGIDIIPLPLMPEIDLFPDTEQMKDERYQEQMGAKIAQSLQLSSNAEKEAIASEQPDLMLCGSPLSVLTAKDAGVPGVLTILQPHGKKTLQYFMNKMADNRSPNNLFQRISNLAGLTAGSDFRKSSVEAIEMTSLIFVEGMPEISGDINFDEISRGFAPMEEWLPKIKPKIRFTGPLLAETPESFPGQEELKLRHTGDADKPLVYVTIGGGTSLIGEEFLSIVLEMFRRLPGINGLISTGLAVSPGKLAGYNPPPNAVIHKFVPGTELIKASDVTVFHGGSSTLMTCIACGRPAVVVPSMAEQEDNGAVLSANGAGIVLNKQGLTVEILLKAVQKVLSDTSFRDQAQKLKTLGEKYGGAAGAATMIEELLKERSLVNAGVNFSGW